MQRGRDAERPRCKGERWRGSKKSERQRGREAHMQKGRDAEFQRGRVSERQR